MRWPTKSAKFYGKVNKYQQPSITMNGFIFLQCYSSFFLLAVKKKEWIAFVVFSFCFRTLLSKYLLTTLQFRGAKIRSRWQAGMVMPFFRVEDNHNLAEVHGACIWLGPRICPLGESWSKNTIWFFQLFDCTYETISRLQTEVFKFHALDRRVNRPIFLKLKCICVLSICRVTQIVLSFSVNRDIVVHHCDSSIS